MTIETLLARLEREAMGGWTDFVNGLERKAMIKRKLSYQRLDYTNGEMLKARNEFESWLCAKGWNDPHDLGINAEGKYKSALTDRMWQAWLTASKAAIAEYLQE